MAPPPNRTFTGTQHPTGALLVCEGSQTTVAPARENDNTADLRAVVITMNVYAFKDRSDGDKVYFGIELYNSGGYDAHGRWRDGLQGEHQWMPEAEYLRHHADLWRDWDMDANFDFDIDGGLRDRDGVVQNGSNRLVERGGGLKMAAIRDNCP